MIPSRNNTFYLTLFCSKIHISIESTHPYACFAGVAVVGNEVLRGMTHSIHENLPRLITQCSRRIAAELNTGASADSSTHYSVDEIVYLPAANSRWLGRSFDVLSGRSLLVTALCASTGQLRQLHSATPISWRAQVLSQCIRFQINQQTYWILSSYVKFLLMKCNQVLCWGELNNI